MESRAFCCQCCAPTPPLGVSSVPWLLDLFACRLLLSGCCSSTALTWQTSVFNCVRTPLLPLNPACFSKHCQNSEIRFLPLPDLQPADPQPAREPCPGLQPVSAERQAFGPGNRSHALHFPAPGVCQSGVGASGAVSHRHAGTGPRAGGQVFLGDQSAPREGQGRLPRHGAWGCLLGAWGCACLCAFVIAGWPGLLSIIFAPSATRYEEVSLGASLLGDMICSQQWQSFYARRLGTELGVPRSNGADSLQVQDEAAGMVVAMLDPQPGDALLDACAAPGGKTLYAAAR